MRPGERWRQDCLPGQQRPALAASSPIRSRRLQACMQGAPACAGRQSSRLCLPALTARHLVSSWQLAASVGASTHALFPRPARLLPPAGGQGAGERWQPVPGDRDRARQHRGGPSCGVRHGCVGVEGRERAGPRCCLWRWGAVGAGHDTGGDARTCMSPCFVVRAACQSNAQGSAGVLCCSIPLPACRRVASLPCWAVDSPF